MNDEQDRLMDLFNEARAKGSAEERDAFLTAACGGDAVLRRQIEILLQAHTQLGDFLKPPADDPPESERPSAVIGRYKLLEQIGEGGFGVVFMAEQLEPIRRRVALKLIKPGMDTKQVIARFEAERQALALLDHPNIARVFDAGATESGRPYFVMELVQGVPITRFCDANDLTAPERLKLFQTVCEAVQHAHQKGIIHRDLKPSNILVTLHDGKPVPKVIDFGTAKALQQPLTEKTLFTAYGKLLGTPQYMSPEQAELSGLDVDTRADIYSLGVLLYELLTGTTPFEVERLRTAAFEEMMRIIRQEDPPKPSTRVSTLGERATEIARHRQVDPNLLQRSLKGDLDWIVMKALDKDRRRRYETASALEQDIRRHIDHHPVLASPPGAVYRMHKFIRRHRMGVALATSVSVALIGGLVAALIGFAEARRERDRAVAAETQAEQSQRQAEAERDRAVTAEVKTEQERNHAELLAAEAALDGGQSKLEAGDSWGLLDVVRAFELAEHNPDFQKAVGRRWSTWHTLWSRRTIAERSMGTPSPDFLQFVSIFDWSPANHSSQTRLYDTLTGTMLASPMMHESTAVGCAFSSDGRQLATVTDKGVIHLWYCRTGKPIRPPYETGVAELNQLRFSSDGRYLVAFSRQNMGPNSAKLALISLEESHESAHLLEHRYPVGDAQFSPDGELLAVLCKPDLQLWRTSDLKKSGSPIAINFNAYMEFSADSRRLAFSPQGTPGIGLLDTRTLRVLRVLPKERTSATGVSFSHDGRLLASFDWDCNLELWKTQSGDGPFATHRTGVRAYNRFAFSPDDSLMAVGDVAGTVRVLRTDDGRIVHKLHTQQFPRPEFLPNGVLATPAQSRVQFWDLTASPLPGLALPDDFLAHTLEFDRSGSFLAVGSEGELRLWTMQPSPKLERILPMRGPIVALTWLQEENQFVAFSDDGSLTKVEPRTGMATTMRNVGRGGGLSACLSPDARKLALFRYVETLVVDTQTGAIDWIDYKGGALSAAFRPDSQRLARGTASWAVWLYDTSALTNTTIGRLKEFEGWVEGVAYHPDGNLLAVCVMGNTLHLYDCGRNRNIGSVRTTSVQANSVRFSADGSLLAVAGPLREGGHAVEIWHVDPQRGLFDSGVCLRRNQPIWSIAFSPDDGALIVGGVGSTRLWRLPPQPNDLEEVQWQTWKTLGFRMEENGKRTYLDPSTNGVEKIRARLTQAPESSDTPLDAALKLPPGEALTAVQQLADQHPEANVYQQLLGRLHADLLVNNAQQSLWTEALAHADDAIRAGVNNPYLRHQRALLALGAGDDARYRAECRDMMKRYRASNDPDVIKWLGWSAALAPGALEDYTDLVERSRSAAPRVGGWHAEAYRFYIGAVLARAGRFQQAVAELEQVALHLKAEGAYVGFSPVYPKFLLAICHAHLGHEDAARQWFEAAALDARNLLQTDQGATTTPNTIPWNRELTIRLLQAEARSLLNPAAPAPTP